MSRAGAEAAGPLDGVRVVELASEHAAFAGKVLADLGAEVIVVEAPDGHATRWFEPFADDVPGAENSLWWWFYNAGKSSVAIDLDDASGVSRFRALVASSDVVLEGEAPGHLADRGLDYGDFEPVRPDLVWVSVTPFGRANPRAHEPATDLTVAANAGPAWSCGYDDHALPPVRPGGNQAYHTVCLWAVMGAMAALYARDTLGIGQHVDVSMHAASNVTTEAATYEWLVAHATVERQTFRHAAVRRTPDRIITAADGRHAIGALPRLTAEFRALADWLVELGLRDEFDEYFFLELGVERGGILLNEVDRDPLVAAIYRAGYDALRAVAAHLTAKEFFVGAQRRGLPAGVLMAPEDVIEDEHFVARGFPVEVHHDDRNRSFVYPGAPYHAPAAPWRVRGRAPHVGEHTAAVLDALGTESPRRSRAQ
ncbi:MAG TPA: CoA transferase [Acidimicrobiia bacterium]|nr:CoA transferase [Acidimicrobiia bacterium]